MPFFGEGYVSFVEGKPFPRDPGCRNHRNEKPRYLPFSVSVIGSLGPRNGRKNQMGNWGCFTNIGGVVTYNPTYNL